MAAKAKAKVVVGDLKDTQIVWAVAALEKAGWGKVPVYRVYPPYDSQDPIECLFITVTGLAKTAYMNPAGKVVGTLDHW